MDEPGLHGDNGAAMPGGVQGSHVAPRGDGRHAVPVQQAPSPSGHVPPEESRKPAGGAATFIAVLLLIVAIGALVAAYAAPAAFFIECALGRSAVHGAYEATAPWQSLEATPYEQRYYYRNLSDADQERYRLIFEAVASHSECAYLLEPYDDRFQDVARAVMMDCPEFFYFDTGGEYSYNLFSTSYKIRYLYDEGQSAEMRAQIEQSAAEALAVTGQSPDDALATARSINDWIVANVEYDYDAAAASDEEFYASHYATNTIFGALVDGDACCGGYARAFEYLCMLEGIDCVYLEGDIAGETAETSGPHAWDLACIDGVWGNVDPTWCDQTSSDEFFMVPDSVHNETLVEKLSPYEVPAA